MFSTGGRLHLRRMANAASSPSRSCSLLLVALLASPAAAAAAFSFAAQACDNASCANGTKTLKKEMSN
jgi:hypothetical protein